MALIRKLLVRALQFFLIGSFALLTLDVLWGVFSRYVLGEQSRWTEELATYLLVWVSLLGAALTYEEKGHLGVDYLVSHFDPGARKLAAVFVEAVMLFFAVGLLVVGGWTLVFRTLEAGQVTPALGWKVGYLYAAAPISGLFFALFSLEHLCRILRGREPSSSGADTRVSDV